MNYRLNLKELSPESTTVQGVEMAVVNKENGTVYLTTKPYIDKLFSLMGYKNLNVIKILEEYAGKTISSIGNLEPYQIYIDDLSDSFVVATRKTIEWVTAMINFLESSQFTFESIKRYDTCYYWDQIVVTNRFGSKFAIYVDLCDEYVRVLSLKYDDKGVLVGVVNEDKYSFEDGQDSFDSFKLMVSGNVDISSYFTLDEPLSIYEYLGLLRSLHYVGSRKGKFYKLDESEEITETVGNLDAIIDLYNDMSWIQRRINKTPDEKDFYDACTLITMNLDDHTIWSFVDFYSNNQHERSDMFALNY